jgi:hypothetical protein
LVARKLKKLLMSNPAPVRRSKESATCKMTRSARNRRLGKPPLEPFPPRCNISLTFGRETWSAGTRPKNRVLAPARAKVKSQTLALIPMAPRWGRSLRGQRAEQIDGPPGEKQTCATARDGEEQTFQEQLPNDKETIRPERGTDRDLPAASGGAGQEQVGDIGASDQEDNKHSGGEDEQGGPHIANGRHRAA